MFTPFSFASFIMIWPAQTKVSLLARAISFFAFMAAMVGRIPSIPTTAVTTISESEYEAACISPSIPVTISGIDFSFPSE